MEHIWIRFRLILPILFGFLAAVLMTWDYENNRMVGLMGMGWDMGPPFWPYQAIYLLLSTINAPAFVLSMPILKLLNLQTLSLQYGVWFPAIVGWWWWIGTRMDFGILGRRSFRYSKLVAGGLSTVSLVLLLIAAMRLFQGRIAPAIEGRHKYRLPVIGVAVVALYVFVIHHWDKSLNPPPDYDECAIDRLYGLGCIHGTVVEENGKPISHIEVDLIPVHKTG